MNVAKLALAVALAATLVACESKKPAEPPKAAAPAPAAAAPTAAAQPAAAQAPAKEEAAEPPDPHGMPGMADLFKDKPGEKK